MNTQEKKLNDLGIKNKILFSYFPPMIAKDLEGYKVGIFLIISSYYILWLITLKFNFINDYINLNSTMQSAFIFMLLNMIFPEKFVSNNKIFFSILFLSLIDFFIITHYIPSNNKISGAIILALFMIKSMDLIMKRQEMKSNL